MYTYVLQGGSVPPEYVEVVLRRDLHLTTQDLESLSAEKLNEFLAVLQGENKGMKEKATRNNG